MTDEEMAEEWVKENCDDGLYSFRGQELQKAFLAGLKAGEAKAKKEIEAELLKCYQGYPEAKDERN